MNNALTHFLGHRVLESQVHGGANFVRVTLRLRLKGVGATCADDTTSLRHGWSRSLARWYDVPVHERAPLRNGCKLYSIRGDVHDASVIHVELRGPRDKFQEFGGRAADDPLRTLCLDDGYLLTYDFEGEDEEVSEEKPFDNSFMSTFCGHKTENVEIKILPGDKLVIQLHLKPTDAGILSGDIWNSMSEELQTLVAARPDSQMENGLILTDVERGNGSQLVATLQGPYSTYMNYYGAGPKPKAPPESKVLTEDSTITKETTPMNNKHPFDQPIQTRMNTSEPTAPTAWSVTRDNMALAGKIAASRVVSDKLFQVLRKHLAERDIDTSLLDSPAGRALVQLALPTMVLAALNTELARSHMPPDLRVSLAVMGEAAQLGAGIEGFETLMQMAMPLLADFASVKGELEEGGLDLAQFEPQTVPHTESA